MKSLYLTIRRLSVGVICGFASATHVPANDLRVPKDYPSIQSAIDASLDGDTIRIAAGQYQEQIVIESKNLTLSGEPGAVVFMPPSSSQTLANYGICWTPMVSVILSDVSISGLEFDGIGMANSVPGCGLAAIFLAGSSGRVTNCVFAHCNGQKTAGGVVTANPASFGAAIVDVSVRDCRFSDMMFAIWVDGDFNNPSIFRTRFNISNNTITGNGSQPDGVQRGISIAGGASGEITTNRISNMNYTGPDPTLHFTGVFLFDGYSSTPVALQPIRVEGNTFSNVQLGISALVADNCQLIRNTCQGPGLDAVRSIGIAVSGREIRIDGNFISRHGRAGIVLIGNDPVFGTALGICHNVNVVSNRFCEVAQTVEVEPLVSGVTQTNNLTCPFPPPTLAIAPAVILSWPFDGTGYLVESATSPAGPWIPTGLTPTVTNGQSTVSVRVDASHGFFRLRAP